MSSISTDLISFHDGRVSFNNLHVKFRFFHCFVDCCWQKKKIFVFFDTIFTCEHIKTIKWWAFLTDCKKPLGLQNGKILDKQMKASSAKWISEPNCCKAKFARLNRTGRWLPKLDDPNKWIKIDLVDNYTVTGIITQGAKHWVTYCKVKYEEMAGSGNLVYIKDVEGNIEVIVAKSFTTLGLNLRYPVNYEVLTSRLKICLNSQCEHTVNHNTFHIATQVQVGTFITVFHIWWKSFTCVSRHN